MTEDEREIRALVQTWIDASRAGDIERVLELMDDDVVFLGPGRPPMRGKAAFAAASRASAGMRMDGRSEIQEVQVFGDVAYSWNQLTVVAQMADGTERRMEGPAMSVLRRNAQGRWVIYRDANMLAPTGGQKV